MSEKNANYYLELRKQLLINRNRTLLITEQQKVYTYGDIDAESARLANYMTDLGVKPGDRVSVQVEKSPQALCLFLACLRAGFVFHPLNPAYQANELDYFLGNAEPAMLVCDSNNSTELEILADAADIKHLLTLDANGGGSLILSSRDCSDQFTCVPRAADDLAALLYSSGTTGVPKGIMLSHDNLVSNARTLVEAWGFSGKDHLLHALPIFHVHGLFVAFGCVLLSGASMRWLSSFNSEAAIQFLPECTVMMGVPTYYTRLLDDPQFNAKRCANVRLFVSGSAPLLEETFSEFEKRSGHRILERYGMTETNMNTSNPLDGERKAGTVGPALPGVEIRIVDDEGEVLPEEEVGNLQVKGPNVFKGYWKMPDKTEEDFTGDGWFNTGDKGKIDSDSYVSIVGRSKDVVITGGLNVYPKEVELVIDELDGVSESAVIGVPHTDFGEAVVAVVVPQEGSKIEPANIIKQTRKMLANFKVPKQVVIVEELPRNTMGKVQKNVLRDEYANLLD